MGQEEWQELWEFPGYAVSTLGDVKNIKTERIRRPTINYQGIAKVTIMRDGRMYTKAVAVLVSDAFIPVIGGAYNSLINLDGDRVNNAVDNLMRRPRWFAVKYHKQFVDPEFHRRNKRLHLRETEETFASFYDVCSKYGILMQDIIRSVVTGEECFPTDYSFPSRAF